MWIIMDQLLQIGHVEVSGVAVALVSIVGIAAAAACIFSKRRPKGCLDPEKFKEFKLVRKRKLNHNTDRFTFSLPTPTSVLGLHVGQHIRCRGKDNEGKEVIRPYTPITLDSDVGYFELVVKMYPKGRMSHYFREMREGEWLGVKGPAGHFTYKPGQVRAFGMLAGGSGITPMFQLTRAILENPKDKTKVHLIYANTTFEDILLKEELDGYASKFPNHFKVYYVLSQPPERWKGGIGHISKEMIQSHCPAPSPHIQHLKRHLEHIDGIPKHAQNEKEKRDTEDPRRSRKATVLRCGPPQMNKAMASHLNDLYYTSEMQFEF